MIKIILQYYTLDLSRRQISFISLSRNTVEIKHCRNNKDIFACPCLTLPELGGVWEGSCTDAKELSERTKKTA